MYGWDQMVVTVLESCPLYKGIRIERVDCIDIYIYIYIYTFMFMDSKADFRSVMGESLKW